ncbi:hypothetical protein DLAC_07675 [Tieghemostelium lacteum]|uniref:Uncharacterized protein n=1 Tax=Tieghemostelium lacteum TaxID=361077 RepID=A0A151ZD67_TIELA|nr:hypothetical protein DLAC_07675 [Tieghemostelium lacteum]|eukprot:KYQ91865.1 hypothetical protein DLAC_07675 [Tieghemostelium lacteum]
MMNRFRGLFLLLLLVIVINVVRSQFTSTGFPIQVLDSTSPWNTVIGPTPTLDSNSVAMITKVKNTVVSRGYGPNLYLHYFQWTCPIHLINTSQSVNRITIYQPNGEAYHETVDPLGIKRVSNLPVSTTFNPDPKADGHMIVFDVALKQFYEFSRFVWINSTAANATRFDTFSWNSTGLYPAYVPGSRWWMKSVRGSGAPFIAGLVRYDEIVRGDVNHALALAGPINRMKALSSSPWSAELCSPVACRNDGWEIGTDTIMEGQRLQLNPSFNITALSPKSKLIAQALQIYGGYIVDNSDDFGIYLENKGPYSTSPWVTVYGSDLIQLFDIPIDQFRVLQCPTIATK